MDALLATVVNTLAQGHKLPDKYKDHSLIGNYNGCREYHITPDWLLIYELSDKINDKINDKITERNQLDFEVDQMVLNFPILASYAVMDAGSRLIFLTHGHVLSEQNPPKLHQSDIFIQGHTHIPRCVLNTDIYYLNPGSVSIPKNNSWHGYMTMETSEKELKIRWASLEGSEVDIKPLTLTM